MNKLSITTAQFPGQKYFGVFVDLGEGVNFPLQLPNDTSRTEFAIALHSIADWVMEQQPTKE